MENGVVNLARKLEGRGLQHHVACLERLGSFADRLPAPDRAFVLGKKSGFSKCAVRNLAAAISQLRPHVIHTHNLGPLIYASLATWFGLRIPILHGEHSKFTVEDLSPRRLLQRRILYRACHSIHTVSKSMRTELLESGFPPKKISSISNGVDTTHFSPVIDPGARLAEGIPEDAIVIGVVGRFGPYKGHSTMVDAFNSLAPLTPRARLLLVGGGGSEEAHVIRQIAASPFRERIHATGFQKDPARFYRLMDLLAIPSSNEGLSNAALEAMASGVPILGNVNCGHEEFVENGVDGIIADLSTPQKLAEELRSLLADATRLAEIGRLARKKMSARFSLEVMAAAYEQLYLKIAPAA